MQQIDFLLSQFFTVFSLAALVLKTISSHYRHWLLNYKQHIKFMEIKE